MFHVSSLIGWRDCECYFGFKRKDGVLSHNDAGTCKYSLLLFAFSFLIVFVQTYNSKSKLILQAIREFLNFLLCANNGYSYARIFKLCMS